MKSRRVKLPGIVCPHCQSHSTVRTSVAISATLRQLRYGCTNHECGHTFAADLTITHTIVGSAQPNPDVHLPFATRALKPANDDNRTPANDDDAGAPAAMKPG